LHPDQLTKGSSNSSDTANLINQFLTGWMLVHHQPRQSTEGKRLLMPTVNRKSQATTVLLGPELKSISHQQGHIILQYPQHAFFK